MPVDVYEITMRDAPNVCPLCRSGDHGNHRTGPVTHGPQPEPGACYSLGNGAPCTCSWRQEPTSSDSPTPED